MKNSDLAERFAQGATKGKGSHMFIEGDTIYSYGYHFLIATRKDGYYLFNKNDYSNTTSTHKSYVKWALNGIVIEVKDCKKERGQDMIADNLEEIERIKDKLTRARVEHSINGHKRDIEKLKEQNNLIKKYILSKEMV